MDTVQKMSRPVTSKGEATRQHILDAALAAFRDRGFANTTMRDIAKGAGMSLGAAYHYFDSKDAIIAAYYTWMQEEHERRFASTSSSGGVAAKIKSLLTTKLDLLRSDRKILVALFATLADPDHPLSLFGPVTSGLRDRSVAMFREAFDDAGLSDELQELAGYAAWMAHLGVLLYFVHDRSRSQSRTRTLADAVGELVGFVVPLASTPPFDQLVGQAAELARKLGAPGGS